MRNEATPPPRPEKKRRWSFALLALLLGLVLAAIGIETAFRLFWQLPPWFAEFQQAGMYVTTPNRDTALRPGYTGALKIGETVAATVAINALGLRGPELAAKKPAERRVLVLGDSLVFGYGIEAEQALPARLQAELRRLGVESTVGNAGVPGYGSKHAVARMAQLDPLFGSDAFVLCGFLGNDAMDEVRSDRTVYAGLMLQGPVARLVHTSWRARLALRLRAALWFESWVYVNYPQWSPLAQLPPDSAEAARMAGMPPQHPVDQAHAGLFLDVIDESTTWADGTPPVIPRVQASLRSPLQRAKEVAGVRPLLFVVLPTLWQVVEPRRIARLQELELDPEKYQRGLAQQRWLAVAQELGVPALDATPILAAEPDPEQLFLADGGHLSVRGNEVVAKWLAGELASRLK